MSELRARENLKKSELEQIAKSHLLGFARYSMPAFEANWHHKVMAKALTRLYKRDIENLMIFMPPRMGKSETASRRFPAWAMGKNPDLKIIATSYADSLASANNRDVQRAIDTEAYKKIFPNTTLSGENVRSNVQGTWLRNNDIFEVVGHRGAYKSAGCGSGITGLGFNIGIIDDPFKDWKEADSDTVRQARWDWYNSTFYTRKEKNAGILLIMTRWHEDDLAGRIIETARQTGEKWTIVSFPMIKEDTTNPTGYEEFFDKELQAMDPRKPGEALWPDKKSVVECEMIRKAVGARIWNGLFQQRPSVAGGKIIKREWIKYWKQLPVGAGQTHLISLDATFKDTSKSDFVTMGYWMKHGGGQFYLVDQVRDRMDIVATMAALKAFSAKHPKAFTKLIEDKANGSAIMQLMKKDFPGMVAINPTDSKEARLSAVAPAFEAGNVWLPDPSLPGMAWVNDYVNELTTFPNSVNDDQVDQTSQALLRLGVNTGDLLAKLTNW